MSLLPLRRIDPYYRQTILRRLERLTRLRRDNVDELNEVGIRLLDQSIVSTYQDCCEVGAAGAATEILQRCRG